MLFRMFMLSLIINITHAVLYLDQEMQDDCKVPRISWELHVDMSRRFPKSGLFGRGCGEGLSLISTGFTCVNPGVQGTSRILCPVSPVYL